MPAPDRPSALQGFLAFLGIAAAMFVGFVAAGALMFAGAPFWLVPVVMFGTPVAYVAWLVWRGVRKLRESEATPEQEAAKAALPVVLPVLGAFVLVALLSFGGMAAAVALNAPGWVAPVAFLAPGVLFGVLAGPALKRLPERFKRIAPSPERLAVPRPARTAEPVELADPADYPTVPDDPSTDGTRLARRLPDADLPAGLTCLGCLGVTLFWNGIVSVFIWQAVKGFLAGKPEWFLVVFLIPFVLVGLGMVVGLVFSALVFVESLMVGPLTVEVDAHPFAPGGRYAGHVRQGGLFRLSQVGVALVCTESATYQAGTTESTDKREVSRHLAELPEPLPACPTDFAVTVPADAMHSFEAKKNKIVWTVSVWGKVLGSLPYSRSFQVVVRPGAEDGG